MEQGSGFRPVSSPAGWRRVLPLENVSKQNFAWRRAFKGGVKQSREEGGISVRVRPRAAAAFTQSHRVVGIASEEEEWRSFSEREKSKQR